MTIPRDLLKQLGWNEELINAISKRESEVEGPAAVQAVSALTLTGVVDDGFSSTVDVGGAPVGASAIRFRSKE